MFRLLILIVLMPTQIDPKSLLSVTGFHYPKVFYRGVISSSQYQEISVEV